MSVSSEVPSGRESGSVVLDEDVEEDYEPSEEGEFLEYVIMYD